jgi:hypothetical protein
MRKKIQKKQPEPALSSEDKILRQALVSELIKKNKDPDLLETSTKGLLSKAFQKRTGLPAFISSELSEEELKEHFSNTAKPRWARTSGIVLSSPFIASAVTLVVASHVNSLETALSAFALSFMAAVGLPVASSTYKTARNAREAALVRQKSFARLQYKTSKELEDKREPRAHKP